jgi:hypothetical protein
VDPPDGQKLRINQHKNISIRHVGSIVNPKYQKVEIGFYSCGAIEIEKSLHVAEDRRPEPSSIVYLKALKFL